MVRRPTRRLQLDVDADDDVVQPRIEPRPTRGAPITVGPNGTAPIGPSAASETVTVCPASPGIHSFNFANR